MLTRPAFAGVVGSLVALSLLFAGPVAYASPLPGDVNLTDAQVAAAVEKASPTLSSKGAVKPFAASGNRVTSGRVTMVLPDASTKISTVSGTRTYRDAKASYAVRGTTDGIQALSVVSSADGPREFRYDFPGQYLTFEQGLVVVRAGNATGELVGITTPAWAKDAKGKPVDTWYSIADNTTLVQHINPTAATVFPVVADPTTYITLTDVYTRFTRSETQWLASNGAYFTIGAAACRIIPFLPVSLACTVYASWALINIGQGIVAANNPGRCAAVHFYLGIWGGYYYGKTDSWGC